MNKQSKILLWILVLLSLSISLILVAPTVVNEFINTEAAKQRIRDLISEGAYGKNFDYGRIDIAWLPRPHAEIQATKIAVPGSFVIEAPSLKLYLKFLPLLRGDLEISTIKLDSPEYTLRLPPQLERQKPSSQESLSFDDLARQMLATVAELPEFKLPHIELEVTDGKLTFEDSKGPLFKFRFFNASYKRTPDKLDYAITCRSNIWESISINGWLNPHDYKGSSQINLAQFRPQSLSAYLFPDSDLQLTEAEASFSIGIQSEGIGLLNARFDGTIPFIKILQGEEELTIKGERFNGEIRIEKDTAKAEITELSLTYPQLTATGNIAVDMVTPKIDIELEGRQLDANAVREVVLALFGQDETVALIFDIVRGGQVPAVVYQTSGSTIAELGNFENMTISGKMENGRIFIPEVDLDLQDVEGEALISRGILTGQRLSARLGNSTGGQGQLKLGLLNWDRAPFQLNINVDADLSQLPPVLNQFVENKAFHKELALVENVKGTARGTLKIGDSIDDIQVWVNTTDVQLAANYRRIPYPLKISGGSFRYEGSQISLDSFDATIEKSSVADISATLDWGKAASLTIAAKAAKIEFEELHPWLAAFERYKKYLQPIDSVKGRLFLSNAKINGPLFTPDKWQLQTGGTVENLVLDSKLLPARLTAKNGRLSWQKSRVRLQNFEMRLGKSAISGLSADLNLKGPGVVTLQTGPTTWNLPELYPWLLSFDSLQKTLARFQPVTGTLACKTMALEYPLKQTARQNIKLSGEIDTSIVNSKKLPGPLKIDSGGFHLSEKQIVINNFYGSLGRSRASRLSAEINMGKSPYLNTVSESAHLDWEDLHPWLLTFESLQGVNTDFLPINGKVHLSDLSLNSPRPTAKFWRAKMTADMENLTFKPTGLDKPLVIAKGSVKSAPRTVSGGMKTVIEVLPTEINWGDSQAEMSGTVQYAADDLSFDLSLGMNTMDWVKIQQIIDSVEAGKPKKSNRAIEGKLKFYSENFRFKEFNWHPVQADITFKPGRVAVAVEKADLCGIIFSGVIKVKEDMIELYIVPRAVNQELDPTITCISDSNSLATGQFMMHGQFLAKSKRDALPRSLGGNLQFNAENGRIYRAGVLAKIFAILNLTEIYRGQVPDLAGEGFAYTTIKASAEVENGKMIMKECAIDAPSMGIACEGSIDLIENEMDVVILVAPFRTIDRIVKNIPIVNTILGGKLISIPFRAKGKLDDPTVIPLPPTAVGAGVLGIMERTLKLPIDLIHVFDRPEEPKKKIETPPEQ